MFGFKLNAWLIAGVAVFLLASAVIVFFKFSEAQKDKLRTEIALLKANEAKYTLALETQEETIEFLEAQQKRIREDFERIQKDFVNTRRANAELLNRITKMNLSKSASESPSAAEIIINTLANDMNRCFELETGAELNEKELAATTPEEFNSECPWHFKK